MAVGTPVVLRGEANDPGAADALLYSWAVRDVTAPLAPPVATGTGPDFTFTPAAGGLFRIDLTVNDQEGGVDTGSVVLDVTGGPPLATINVPATGQEGTPVRALAALAALADLVRTDSLAYEWSVRENGAAYPFTRLDEGGIDFTPNDNGQYAVGLTVVSGGLRYPAFPAAVAVTNVAPQAAILDAPPTTPAGSR